MAICKECGQEMPEADSCTYDFIGNGSMWYARRRDHFGESNGRCNDCGIKHGGIHHFGCDVERCPKCGLQLIGCYCWPDTLLLKRTDNVRRFTFKG